jgi:hypothetical protein
VCSVCAKLHDGRDRDIVPRYDHDYEDDAPFVFMNEELDWDDGP